MDGWLISNPDEEQNRRHLLRDQRPIPNDLWCDIWWKSFYRYEEGRWEIIGEKLVLYEDAPVNGNDNTRFANVNVARVYTRRRIILKYGQAVFRILTCYQNPSRKRRILCEGKRRCMQ